jgi:AraC-like DNA-binding protein
MLELIEELDATYTHERTEVNRPWAEAEAAYRRLGRRYAKNSAEDAARFARARQLRLDGFRVLTISRETGISPKTLTRHFRRHGITISGRGRPPVHVAPPTAPPPTDDAGT